MKAIPARRHILASIVLIINSLSFAGDNSKEALALFERAKKSSDIRAVGSGAFILKGKFAILRDPDHPIIGAYTEVWASPSLQRIEISTETFHSIKVTNDRKQWELNDGSEEKEKDVRSAANVIAYRMTGSWMDSRGPAKIIDRGNGSWILRCIDGQDDEYGGRQEFCFDKSGGQLVASSLPFIVKGGESARRCAYTDFQKFGTKSFQNQSAAWKETRQFLRQKLRNLFYRKPIVQCLKCLQAQRSTQIARYS